VFNARRNGADRRGGSVDFASAITKRKRSAVKKGHFGENASECSIRGINPGNWSSFNSVPETGSGRKVALYGRVECQPDCYSETEVALSSAQNLRDFGVWYGGYLPRLFLFFFCLFSLLFNHQASKKRVARMRPSRAMILRYAPRDYRNRDCFNCMATARFTCRAKRWFNVKLIQWILTARVNRET